jgi:hypothetical protein
MMKNFKIFAFVAMVSVSQVNAVDVPALWKSGTEYSGKQLSRYGKNLLDDTPTQAITVSSVVATVAAYKYYHYQAALVCLDGHYNSKIMHTSNLIYMTYSDFLHKVAAMNSYGQVTEFINQYCTTCYSVSDAKVNKFIALVNDLQRNNSNQNSITALQENAILETFKGQLVMTRENIRQELINGAIAANTNANNAVTARLVIDIIQTLASFFGGSN